VDVIPRLDRAFDGLERGDLDAFVAETAAHTDPECIFRSGIGSEVGGGVYVGVEGIREWFGDLLTSTSERRWENRCFETYGDDVLVFLADFSLTGVASGAAVTGQTGAVFYFENGLCRRIVSFMSHAEARAEAEAHVA
jgi:hypothetical protein